jgi:ABC-type bacteriocin/lantibiotic exporter with double-glycine peptidase domain
MRHNQRSWINAVQKRVSFTSAILKSLRQVKMLGIESTMTLRINDLREAELNSSKPYRSLIVWVNVLGALTTTLAPAATIVVYAVAKLDLKLETPKADVVFTSLYLVSLLASSVVLLSVSVTRVTSAIGCFDRIQGFLLREKQAKRPIVRRRVYTLTGVEPASAMELESAPTQSQFLVNMDDCSFSLRAESPILLHAVDLKVPRSSFCAVTGALGCGKSSLLQAILGELNCRGGRVGVSAGQMAYCQQIPCIYNGTLKTNILGESAVDENWLREVVSACELAADVKRLPGGLDTAVGNSGPQMSGGQRQRLVSIVSVS